MRASYQRGQFQAFTLVEMLMVVVIIALLALLSFEGYGAYKRYVEKAQCLSHMRTVHLGLASFVADRHHWPQPPMSVDEVTEESWFKWWIAQTAPYDVPAEAWVCPTDKVDPEDDSIGPIGERGSYVPTVFDSGRYTPYRWAQPWLMERGNMHGKGAHIVMPRGEIITSEQLN